MPDHHIQLEDHSRRNPFELIARIKRIDPSLVPYVHLPVDEWDMLMDFVKENDTLPLLAKSDFDRLHFLVAGIPVVIKEGE